MTVLEPTQVGKDYASLDYLSSGLKFSIFLHLDIYFIFCSYIFLNEITFFCDLKSSLQPYNLIKPSGYIWHYSPSKLHTATTTFRSYILFHNILITPHNPLLNLWHVIEWVYLKTTYWFFPQPDCLSVIMDVIEIPYLSCLSWRQHYKNSFTLFFAIDNSADLTRVWFENLSRYNCFLF